MDYVDYKARTFLTQSTNCDDWDAINESLLNLYDDDKLNVVFEDEQTPQFYPKNEDVKADRTNELARRRD